MRWVLCRERDEDGRLLRTDPDLPWWVRQNLDGKGHWRIRNPCSLRVAYLQILEQNGFTPAEQVAAWQAWKQQNPGYGEADG